MYPLEGSAPGYDIGGNAGGIPEWPVGISAGGKDED
jgi:hypothetical protein